MAKDHRRLAEKVAQGILLDDPAFLKEVVERVLQEVLEAEMTEHIGAAPYERSATRTGQRNGYKPRALRTRVGTLNLLGAVGVEHYSPKVCPVPSSQSTG